MRALYSQLQQQLVKSQAPPECLRLLDEEFSDGTQYMDPFSQVKTPHSQLQFYKKSLGLIVCTANIMQLLFIDLC